MKSKILYFILLTSYCEANIDDGIAKDNNAATLALPTSFLKTRDHRISSKEDELILDILPTKIPNAMTVRKRFITMSTTNAPTNSITPGAKVTDVKTTIRSKLTPRLRVIPPAQTMFDFDEMPSPKIFFPKTGEIREIITDLTTGKLILNAVKDRNTTFLKQMLMSSAKRESTKRLKHSNFVNTTSDAPKVEKPLVNTIIRVEKPPVKKSTSKVIMTDKPIYNINIIEKLTNKTFKNSGIKGNQAIESATGSFLADIMEGHEDTKSTRVLSTTIASPTMAATYKESFQTTPKTDTITLKTLTTMFLKNKLDNTTSFKINKTIESNISKPISLDFCQVSNETAVKFNNSISSTLNAILTDKPIAAINLIARSKYTTASLEINTSQKNGSTTFVSTTISYLVKFLTDPANASLFKTTAASPQIAPTFSFSTTPRTEIRNLKTLTTISSKMKPSSERGKIFKPKIYSFSPNTTGVTTINETTFKSPVNISHSTDKIANTIITTESSLEVPKIVTLVPEDMKFSTEAITKNKQVTEIFSKTYLPIIDVSKAAPEIEPKPKSLNETVRRSRTLQVPTGVQNTLPVEDLNITFVKGLPKPKVMAMVESGFDIAKKLGESFLDFVRMVLGIDYRV